MYPSLRRRDAESGFTLLEVLVAIVVLSIGLMSAALVMANMYKFSGRSRYMGMAAQLASEELEDLSRWPASSTFIDPHITVPAGSNTCGITGEACVGSLTSDYGPLTITVSGDTASVSYFDNVCLATNNGIMSETYQMPCTGSPAGTGSYVTVSFTPNGQIPQTSCNSTLPQGMTFERRWVIEQDQPVTGVRRVTVLVTLEDRTVQGFTKGALLSGQLPPTPVTFQMSMVRP